MSNAHDYSDIHIESTLPKPWEEEQTFNDILYDWMSRAPWLLISAAAHLLAFFILAAIPWSYFDKKDVKEIQASLEQTPEEIFEEPEEEQIEEEIEEPIEEPVLQDSEIVETEELDFVEAEGDPDFLSDSPFESDAFNDVIGVGGGAGRKWGQRGIGKGRRARAGKDVEAALQAGLEWLKNHQSPNGSWDCDDFSLECGKLGQNVCDGSGYPEYDVGVTALALLAFLGEGNTTQDGTYQDVVKRGIDWLGSQQDPDSGLIGGKTSKEFVYNHLIATLAMCEDYIYTQSPLRRRKLEKAIEYVSLARNSYGGWRYDVPPLGENDTSVTGWAVLALASAKDADLQVDRGAFDGAMAVFDEYTDPSNGRVGYNEFGSASSRINGVNEFYKTDKGEAMTAVALLCKFFMRKDQDAPLDPIMIKHADLIARRPPKWEPDEFGNDMYYWYYGSYAMYQMGAHNPKYWENWRKAMEDAVLKSQRSDGDEKGSWDPNGPWGMIGGRVYSTSLMVLCLEAFFRYGRVLGSR